MRKYTPNEIELKWQKVWEETRLYEVEEDSAKKKIYASPMLPYPSGAGLHIGHVRNYSIADVVARFYRQRGYNVMSNMGWDSFGLPAENYAIKTGTPPAVSTAENITSFKKQLKRLGISYAWDRELDTSDPDYYKWTQWLFLQFFNDKLAYQAENLQWWCTKCKTVLANEQVVNDKCWRHDGLDDPLVEKRRTKQWFFKITEYADELLDELPNLDWPESITSQQHNWIGRSVGAEVDFKVADEKDTITVFTTRIDTIYGATFLVLAPENQLAENLATPDQKNDVMDYITESVRKSDVDRMDDGKEKTGVFTGAYAINPANNEKIPIWVSDFVLGGYGTGAIMAVPGHDQRDFEFAQKFDLPIVNVIDPATGTPQESPEFKNKIVAVVQNAQDEILTINWGSELGGRLTIGGTVDDGEDFEQAARREVAEETGYADLELLEAPSEIINHDYYAHSKKRSTRAATQIFHFKLASETRDEPQLEDDEKGLFKVEWIPTARALSEIVEPLHALALDRLVNQRRYSGEGTMVHSDKYDGLRSSEAREKVTADLTKSGLAREKVNYKMRDWLISRQRYWGTPIPIIHCDDCGAVPVPEKDLPVVLPEVKDYAPTGGAKSVLATVDEWVNVKCPTCSNDAMRETDTLDGYVCSSWYLYRYCDAGNSEMAWDPEKVNYWFPMDFYFGGDHAVAHLLYFRFWHHFFVDKGMISDEIVEPIQKLVFNGYINADDGSKMSKSKGNVVDPLDIIDSGYGADALRMFELFIGPYDQDVVWNPNGVPGTYRFLQRVWTLAMEFLDAEDTDAVPDPEKIIMLSSTTQKTIKKVTNDLERLRFNTAISACMELVNTLNKLKIELPMAEAHDEWRVSLSQLLQILAPFAPHMAEELWNELGQTESVHMAGWPTWDEDLIADSLTTIVVQVNGKLRAKLELPVDAVEEDVARVAMSNDVVASHTEDGKAVVKTIYIKDKLINFVVKK